MLSKLSSTSLNAYYYALKIDRLDNGAWRDVTLSKALRAVPGQLAAQPLFLSIDDTMVEKAGEKFEFRSKLFGHAAHNGSNYLNGHCMVSILLSFPVLADSSIRYLSVPLGCQLWDKNRQNWELPLGWCARLWASSARTGRCSCSAAAGIQKGALQALWMNTITLTLSAVPGLILSCMAFRLSAQGNAAAQRNMAAACHQMTLNPSHQKLGAGR